VFKEELPAQCPPADAGPLLPQRLLRLTENQSFTDADFMSHAALGRPCFNGKHCEWSACSMFLPTISKTQLDDLRRFPNLRRKSVVAYVEVNQQSGVGTISKTKHVNLWMFKSYDPVKHITRWVPVADYS